MQNHLGTQSLTFQSHYVKCNVAQAAGLHSYGLRGKIVDFSRASRNRQFDMINKLDYQGRYAIFITLTYPDEFPTPEVAKKHLDIFFKRIRRMTPAASAVWRMEFQRRGAVHFHILFFNLRYWPFEELRRTWEEIISADVSWPPGTHVRVRIEAVRSRQSVLSYISKYVAKRAPGFFITCTYLTADGVYVHPTTGETSAIGRHWGVFNRAELPYGRKIVLHVKGDLQAMWRFKRYARRVRRETDKHRYRGFTLYVEDAERWYELWLHCLLY